MSHRILLVEDSDYEVPLVEELLREALVEYDLIRVARLSEGIARVQDDRFDVILLDLALPDSTGVQTVQRMCAAAPAMPIVVFTGAEDEELGVDALRNGAQDYLVKGEADGWALARAIRYAQERKRAKTLPHPQVAPEIREGDG